MVGSKLEPLIKVCCEVMVHFRSQLQEYITRQIGDLGQDFFKNKKCSLNGILLLKFFLSVSCNHHNSSQSNDMKVTSKGIPVQAWAGLEGSRKLRLPDFMTTGTLRW